MGLSLAAAHSEQTCVSGDCGDASPAPKPALFTSFESFGSMAEIVSLPSAALSALSPPALGGTAEGWGFGGMGGTEEGVGGRGGRGGCRLEEGVTSAPGLAGALFALALALAAACAPASCTRFKYSRKTD